MKYDPGDRVRYECTGDDGFPTIRYGFVAGQAADGGPVAVMLDGEIGGTVLPAATLRAVTLTNLELRLVGEDLCSDPALRRGLVALWQAEADAAGLAVERIRPIEAGTAAVSISGSAVTRWLLAELCSCGDCYHLVAQQVAGDPQTYEIRCLQPGRG